MRIQKTNKKETKEGIEKTSTLSHDGTNLLTRIPQIIEEEAKLKKGEKLLWKAKDGEVEVSKHE